MTTRRGLLLALGTAPIVATGGWYVRRRNDRTPADDGLVVVPGRIGPPAAPVHDTPDMADVGTIVPDLGPMSVTERQQLFASLPRDPEWSPRAEAILRQKLSGALPGLVVDAVSCAGGVCQVGGTVPIAPSVSIDAAVRKLLSGAFQHAVAASRFRPNGVMTIDVDDEGNLRFTQYLQPSRDERRATDRTRLRE